MVQPCDLAYARINRAAVGCVFPSTTWNSNNATLDIQQRLLYDFFFLARLCCKWSAEGTSRLKIGLRGRQDYPAV